MTEEKKRQEIRINMPASIQSGAYCNLLYIQHTKEEFILDFMMVSGGTPPSGTVVSRVIISPGHMKRTISALRSNLEKYEASFGPLEEAETPAEERRIGFKTS